MDPSLSLNVHLSVPSNSHSESHTPNTPEILNSIVNMTNGPFANFGSSSASNNEEKNASPALLTTSCNITSSPVASASGVASNTEKTSGLSVQQYCSQFIKEGLKMKVKRKLSASSSKEDQAPLKKPKITVTPAPPPPQNKTPPTPKPPRIEIKEELLSPEDLAKRLRRRERNKLAATKCRNKKKAQFTILAQEHEDLKRQNASFRSESARLEEEKRKLTEVLEKHKTLIPSCPLFLVKREEPSVGIIEREIDPSLGFRRSCSFSNSQQQPSSDFFLAKSAITQSFYDLSSRCMAM